jgi:hypothetical protein
LSTRIEGAEHLGSALKSSLATGDSSFTSSGEQRTRGREVASRPLDRLAGDDAETRGDELDVSPTPLKLISGCSREALTSRDHAVTLRFEACPSE